MRSSAMYSGKGFRISASREEDLNIDLFTICVSTKNSFWRYSIRRPADIKEHIRELKKKQPDNLSYQGLEIVFDGNETRFQKRGITELTLPIGKEEFLKVYAGILEGMEEEYAGGK